MICVRDSTVAPLRVMHVVPSLEVGGMEQLVAFLARGRGGPQTAVACLSGLGTVGQQLREDGIPVHELSTSRSRLAKIVRLRRLFWKHAVDIVHCHNFQAFTFGALAAQASRRWIVVLTKHGTRMPETKSLGEQLRVVMARRSRLVGVSSEIQALLADWSGQDPEQVICIPNGVELSTEFPARQPMRELYALPPQAVVISCVARLSAEKDHVTLLQAFQHVAGNHRDALLLLIGDGPQRHAVESLARTLEIADRIRLLGERHDVPQLLAASDIAVLSSRTEGMPLVLLEAMAAKLPIVATAVGGVPQLVSHGANGWLVPPGDARQLAAAMLHLCRERAEARRMGLSGRTRVECDFSLQRTLDRYEQLYRTARPSSP